MLQGIEAVDDSLGGAGGLKAVALLDGVGCGGDGSLRFFERGTT